MTDNVTFQSATPATPPSNLVVAADDVAGVKYQIVKLAVGGDGDAALASRSNPVPVRVAFDPQQISLDAGGVLRVGSQTTLFDGKTLNADDTSIWENAGTGTGTFTGNKYDMSVTSGQWYVKQAKRRSPYFSGKSQRIEVTFDNFGADANVTKRVGYFSSNAVSPYDSSYDGFWLENNGTTITLKAARAGTETLSVALSSWTGYANLGEYQTVSTWDNFTVVEFKFLWLGGAVLVLSVKTAGGFVEAHRFDYAGTAQDVFIASPNQPVRYEIRSSTGSGSFRYICSQVATEGSIDESGESLAVYNTAAISTNAVGTIYALIGVKKQTTYRDNAIQIEEIGASNNSTTTDAGILMIIINPTLSASLTYANNSKIQVALATNQTITAGTGRVIAAVPASASMGGARALSKNFLAWLSSTLNNTHDEYVLAYMPTTATQSVFGIVQLKEY